MSNYDCEWCENSKLFRAVKGAEQMKKDRSKVEKIGYAQGYKQGINEADERAVIQGVAYSQWERPDETN